MADDRSRGPHLDDAIDRAVREMMSVDPRPGFEHRVLRCLERSARQPFAWPRLAGAAAVLAVLIVIVAVMRDGSSPERRQGLDTVVRPRRPPVLETEAPGPWRRVPTAVPEQPSTLRTGMTKRRAPATGDALRTIEAASVDEPPIATIAALEEPSALDVEDISQQPVSVPNIRMSPLDIGELTVQPLRPLDGRREE